MEYKVPIETYKGQVAEVVIGAGEKQLKIGGENTLPFHTFEGEIKNKPRFALEVYDMVPEGWADAVVEPYKDVMHNPVLWAKKCVDEYKADLVCLQLLSCDPAEKDTPADVAAKQVKEVADAINVPLIVLGCGQDAKDTAVFEEVSKVCSGYNLLLGPVVKENYEAISSVAKEHNHCLIAQAPLDINLTKELLIKLSKIFPSDKVIIDPLTPPLGFGLDYGFTIVERIKQTGVVFGDAVMQVPIIANLAKDVWKTKEAKANKTQGILWEATTALTYILAGANILVLRHPETLKLLRKVIG